MKILHFWNHIIAPYLNVENYMETAKNGNASLFPKTLKKILRIEKTSFGFNMKFPHVSSKSFVLFGYTSFCEATFYFTKKLNQPKFKKVLLT